MAVRCCGKICYNIYAKLALGNCREEVGCVKKAVIQRFYYLPLGADLSHWLFLLFNNYNLLYRHHKDMIVSHNLRVRSVLFEVTTFVTHLSDAIARDVSLHGLISTRYESPAKPGQPWRALICLIAFIGCTLSLHPSPCSPITQPV